MTSATLWLDGGAGGLLADASQLDGVGVGVGSADQGPGCEVLTDRGAGAGAVVAGFAQFPIVCGAAGRYVTLSFPRLAAGRAGALAVRLCTAAAAAGGAFGDATLRVETAPTYA